MIEMDRRWVSAYIGNNLIFTVTYRMSRFIFRNSASSGNLIYIWTIPWDPVTELGRQDGLGTLRDSQLLQQPTVLMPDEYPATISMYGDEGYRVGPYPLESMKRLTKPLMAYRHEFRSVGDIVMWGPCLLSSFKALILTWRVWKNVWKLISLFDIYSTWWCEIEAISSGGPTSPFVQYSSTLWVSGNELREQSWFVSK